MGVTGAPSQPERQKPDNDIGHLHETPECHTLGNKGHALKRVPANLFIMGQRLNIYYWLCGPFGPS